ncbi:hypothetical protein B0I37DRAFT_171900 [Chaetomium sp. MPI-CAGE-AT-0009]|nr:hypothetical protein B0I37DRAFT_171900 [Chaetomium sp. MPI-CAGE-AT-0009]
MDWRTFPGRHPCGEIAAIALGDKIKSPQPSFGGHSIPVKRNGRSKRGTFFWPARMARRDQGRLARYLALRVSNQPASGSESTTTTIVSPVTPPLTCVTSASADILFAGLASAGNLSVTARPTRFVAFEQTNLVNQKRARRHSEARKERKKEKKKKEKKKRPGIQRELGGSCFFKPAHSPTTQAIGVRAKPLFSKECSSRNPPDRVGSVETHPFARL